MTREETTKMAGAMWRTATDEEKAVIRFGMTPVSLLERWAEHLQDAAGKDIAVALMECAERDGGMRA